MGVVRSVRNPKRIRGYCDRLAACWEKVPDWRFGQLLSNVLGEYCSETGRDIFFPEDEELISYFEKFFGQPGNTPFG